LRQAYHRAMTERNRSALVHQVSTYLLCDTRTYRSRSQNGKQGGGVRGDGTASSAIRILIRGVNKEAERGIDVGRKTY
jgi:hypothetical protein